MKIILRELRAFRSIIGKGDPFPPPGSLAEELYWLFHNLRVWVRSRMRPLSDEQRARHERELLDGDEGEPN